MIDQPDNTPNIESTTTDEVETTTDSKESLNTLSEQPTLLDLDSVEKFKFAGREWTPKDLKSEYMMQSDYTRKTQEIAKERQFAENLSFDLDEVLSNPSLVNKFKEIYPQKYHAVVDKLLDRVQQGQGGGVLSPEAQLKKELEEIKAHINQQKAQNEEQKAINFEKEVASASAEIDAIFGSLQKKYEMADENLVLSYAQAHLEKGKKLDKEVYENLFKLSHETNQKRMEQFYSKQVTQQKQANSKAKDMASGGGTLGKAPFKPRNINEATSLLAQELEKQYK